MFRHSATSARDTALLALMAIEGLRRAEALSLDLAHIDEAGCRLHLLGKGKVARDWFAISGRTMEAILAWVQERGDTPGALFPGRGGRGRLTGAAVWYLVRRVGATVGAVARPHGLRHTAITTAIDLRGELEAQQLSRHTDLRMVRRYDDSRHERRRDIARLVSNAY